MTDVARDGVDRDADDAESVTADGAADRQGRRRLVPVRN